jgi:hypothetical protein
LAEGFLDAFADVELGSQLAAGAFADAEKADEIPFTVTLGTFSDVRGNGDGGTLHLVPEVVVFEVVGLHADIHRELAPALPNFQILKGRYCHLVSSLFLKTEH